MTLQDLLDSRDARVARQRELLMEHPGMSLLCLTVQLPGPVKRNDISLKIAKAGVEAVREAFTLEFEEQRDLETGFEAYFLVNMPPFDVKRLACTIEDTHPLGRLMDLDVVVPSEGASMCEDNATLGTRGGTGAKRSVASGGTERSEASEPSRATSEVMVKPLGREVLGLPPRKCLLCGNEVRQCMRARTHTIEELLAKITEIVENY